MAINERENIGDWRIGCESNAGGEMTIISRMQYQWRLARNRENGVSRSFRRK
jgi:hypothetical protein